jgi:hypothetical protein
MLWTANRVPQRPGWLRVKVCPKATDNLWKDADPDIPVLKQARGDDGKLQ